MVAEQRLGKGLHALLRCLHHLLLQGPQGRHIPRRVPRGQLLHGWALQIVPQLQYAARRLGVRYAPVEVHNGPQCLQTAGLGIVRHGDAPAGGDVQKPQPVQLPQPLMDHGLADLYLIGQLPLSGQPVPRTQFAGEDHPLQLLDEQLLHRGRHDLAKGHRSQQYRQ